MGYWERPSLALQRDVVWTKEPFRRFSEDWLAWWFDRPAVIYDTIDQFQQSFPSGPNLDALASDWRYLLGLWTGHDFISDSDCLYDAQSLTDILTRRQIEVWLLGYRATRVQRLNQARVGYDKTTLCDPAERSCIERPGYHFAVHVTPAPGYQIIRFPGLEAVLAVHLIDQAGQRVLTLPQPQPGRFE